MQEQLKEAFGILKQTIPMRDDIIDMLDDADLEYSLEGNPTIGELLRRMGDIQHSYINSFETFKQNFSDFSDDDSLAKSTDKLKTMFSELDEKLENALEAITDEQFKSQLIDRGFPMSIGAQLHTFREGILTEVSKLSVYLRTMGKELPQQVKDWIW